MKKFQFRLQKLLWHHEQRQKQSEVQLQHAGWQRESAVAEIHRIQNLIDLASRLPEAPGKLVDLSARLSIADHLQILTQTLTASQEKLKKADLRLREAKDAYTRITKEVEGLLHLRAEQFAEYRDEVARQQQIVLDEVVMRQWSMRDADTTA